MMLIELRHVKRQDESENFFFAGQKSKSKSGPEK
jgi:hypothetical protein